MATENANWGKMLSLFSGGPQNKPGQRPQAGIGTFEPHSGSDDDGSESFSAIDFALKKAIKL